jgi:hypothetical protein
MATEDEHAAAVLEALHTDDAPAYEFDGKPDVKPPAYNEVAVSRRFGGEQRYSGLRDGHLYRVSARANGQTIAGARAARARVYALEGTVLTIGSATTTPLEFETADNLEPSGGWYSGLTTLTYALI